MIRKKVPYDTMLALALVFSALRMDWTDYLREELLGLQTHSSFHDTLLGPSVGLSETTFHNYLNSYSHPPSKSILRDSFYYNNSALRELDALHDGLSAINTPRTSLEVTTFLLDRSESSSLRSGGGQVVVPQPQNPLSQPNHVNSNGGGNHEQQHGASDIESDEGFEEMETEMELEGAVGRSNPNIVSPTPSSELSEEDMDLIESLWRQDIDMGVCPETYPYKADINKQGFSDDLKKPDFDIWDYSIDGETGEFVPGPQQELEGETRQPVIPQIAPQIPLTQTQVLPQPQPQPQPETQEASQEGSLSLEDCINLLASELSPEVAQAEISPTLSHHEVEQRWQDIATLPELQGSIPGLMPNVTFNGSQGGFVPTQQQFGQNMVNATGLGSDVDELQQPQVPSDVFAMNATTNGMVSLQNATQPSSQHSLLMTPPHNFSNLNINPMNQTTNSAVAALPNENATSDYLMNTLQQQINNTGLPYSAANLSMPENSSSLLMDLLNSPDSSTINPMDLNFDEQMHDVLAALADEPDDLSDEEESDGSVYSEEGASGGYSSSCSDQDSLKGATGGYGYSRGHERKHGSDSSSNSYSGGPPKMENIRHNHSYASPSQSQMQNGNGAQNSSHNGTNGGKLTRDQKRAKLLKLPLDVDKIINLPVDAFNDLIKKYDLNDAQMQLVRDIRRRGKNKVAAQNCRKRKIEAISVVESVVSQLRMERDKLARERDSIDKEVNDMQQRYAELCDEVFSSIQDEHGGPVDPNDFTLQQMPDGTVYLIPRNSTSHRHREEPSL